VLRCFAAEIYDAVIVWMTSKWYAAVFQKLQDGDRILDIGIGTATALVKNKAALLERHLSVVGIDYEAAYVRKAEAVLKTADLWRTVPTGTPGYREGEFYCRVFERSIYDADLGLLCDDSSADPSKSGSDSTACTSIPDKLRFDAAYFSGSLTVMPDPVAALKAVAPLIKANTGRVFITQTFNKRPSPVTAFIKPLMKYLTTIDFGNLTTESDLERIIAEAQIFETLENSPIAGSLDTPIQTARLIVLRIKNVGSN